MRNSVLNQPSVQKFGIFRIWAVFGILIMAAPALKAGVLLSVDAGDLIPEKGDPIPTLTYPSAWDADSSVSYSESTGAYGLDGGFTAFDDQATFLFGVELSTTASWSGSFQKGAISFNASFWELYFEPLYSYRLGRWVFSVGPHLGWAFLEGTTSSSGFGGSEDWSLYGSTVSYGLAGQIRFDFTRHFFGYGLVRWRKEVLTPTVTRTDVSGSPTDYFYANGNYDDSGTELKLGLGWEFGNDGEGQARDTQALLMHGEELYNQHNYGDAEAAFREVIAEQGDNARAWQDLGNVLYMTSRHREAIKAYKKSLSLEPNNIRLQKFLGL